MEKVNRPHHKWQWQIAVFFLIAFLVIAGDQLSKIWIRSNLLAGQSIFEAGLFRLTYVQNTGAAFGLFQGHSSVLAVAGLIGTIVLLLCGLFLQRRYPLLNRRLTNPALGLILGGTIGNLIDRIRFGYVTDFIDFSIWPAFNIADSATVIGTIILAYSLLSLAKSEKG